MPRSGIQYKVHVVEQYMCTECVCYPSACISDKKMSVEQKTNQSAKSINTFSFYFVINLLSKKSNHDKIKSGNSLIVRYQRNRGTVLLQTRVDRSPPVFPHTLISLLPETVFLVITGIYTP